MKHHFVPVGYLKQFVNSRGFLNEASIETRLIRWVHPNNTCYINDYYNLPDELFYKFRLKNKNVLELEAFKVFEDNIGTFSRFFLDKNPILHIDDHVVLVQGYLTQKQRTPYYTDRIDDARLERKAEFVIGALTKTRAKYFELFKTDEKFAPFLKDEYWHNLARDAMMRKEDGHTTQLSGLLTSAMGMSQAVEKIVERLFDMNVGVLCAPDDEYFITSDNPGYTLCPIKPEEYMPHNTNFAAMQSLTYPINSKQALYIYWNDNSIIRGDKPIHYHSMTKQEMLEVNQTITNFAHRKIFCASRGYLQAFVDSYPLMDWELESNRV